MTDSPTPTAERIGSAITIPWVRPVQTQLLRRLETKSPGADPATSFADARALNLELEPLQYCLAGAFDSLRRLLQVHTDLCSESRRIQPGGIHLVSAEEACPLGWILDAFLDAGRRAQNSVMPYLGRTFRTSLPPSLARMAEPGTKYRAALPSDVLDLIDGYWSTAGVKLKGYRDLAQHHVVVGSDVRVLCDSSGVRSVWAVLPNDPFCKPLRDIAYREPYVTVGPFCTEQFEALFEFQYALLYRLLRELGDPATVIAHFVSKAPLKMGPCGGFVSLPPLDLDEVMWNLRDSWKRSAVERFGELVPDQRSPEAASPNRES